MTRSTVRIRRNRLVWAGIPVLTLLFFLFCVPLASTLRNAFGGGKLGSVLLSPYIRHVLGFSLWQALLSTLASLAIGLPGAWIIATYDFPGKKILRAIASIPFVLPSILVVLGFVIFYGNNGFLNRILMKMTGAAEPPLHILYSLGAIILAHAFYNFPLVMQTVADSWIALDPHPEQAALTLGAGRFKAFATITLPRLLPSILSSCAMVFLYCYNSFSIILILGGGPAYTTMETEIYRYAKIEMDSASAAAVALVSLVTALLVMLLQTSLQKRMEGGAQVSSNARRYQKRPRSPGLFLLVLLYALAATVFVLGPIVSVVVRSFISRTALSGGSAFSLKGYRQIFSLERTVGSLSTASLAVKTSLSLALAVAAVALLCLLALLPLLMNEGKLSAAAETLCMLPMAVSSVIVGLGYLFLSLRWGLRGGLMVVLAHLVIAIPPCLRSVLPAARAVPRHYMDAAHTLGAGEIKAFVTILLPILRPAVCNAAALAFAVSLGELNATLTLSGRNVVTIPIVMYRLISSYNYQGACALGTLLILVSGAVFALGEHIKSGGMS